MLGKGLRCIAFVLSVFAVTYIGLIVVYDLGLTAVIITGIALLVLGLGLLVLAERAREGRVVNYCGILAGLFLWSALGEVATQLNLMDLAEWRMFPILLVFTFLVVLVGTRRYLPSGILFALGHFNAIWILHMIMVNQYEFWGKTSLKTYPSCGLVALLAILSAYLMTKRSRSETQNMAYALATLLLSWTTLEYVWGWELIPTLRVIWTS